jgi:hypothetical protein
VSDRGHQTSLVHALLFGLSATILFAACCQTLFLDREPAFDEVGLFNAVYTSLTSGHMTYPAHGDFSAMVVHPPTYYWLVAQIMKTGLRAMTAATLVPLTLLVIDMVLILTASLGSALKASLLGGLFLGGVMFVTPVVLRPDWALALSWFGGIVALESGRRRGWEPIRLSIGGFLVSLASALHYPGVTAGIAWLVYAAYCLLTQPRRAAWRPVLAMACGSAVVTVPFFLFFVIPDFSNILTFTASVQGPGGIGEAVAVHRHAYELMKSFFAPIGSWDAPTRMLTGIPIQLGIPAVLIAIPVLLLMPETRILAAAAAIHPMFILLGSRGEGKLFQGYYTSEFMLFGVAACMLISSMIGWIAGRFWKAAASATSVAIVLIGTITSLSANGTTRSTIQSLQGVWSAAPWRADMEIARAAGRDMLGSDARVAGFAVTWFISGARRMYFTDQSMLNAPTLTSEKAAAILTSFDAVAVQHHRTWLSFNAERMTMTSLYASGRLALRGAYFGYSRGWDEAGLSYLLLAATQPDRLQAEAFDGALLWKYVQDPAGDRIFASAVCPVDEFPRSVLKVDRFITTWLPGTTNADPSTAIAAHEPRQQIRTFIADRKDFQSRIRPMMEGRCTFRTAAAVRTEHMDANRFLDQFQRTDSPITFMSSPEPRAGLTAVPLDLDLAHAHVNPPEKPAQSLPFQSTTPPQSWAYGAVIPWRDVDRQPDVFPWLRLRVHVARADAGIGLLNSTQTSFQWNVQLSPSAESQTVYLPVIEPGNAGPVVIATAASPRSSRVTIEAGDVVLQPSPHAFAPNVKE